MRAALIALIVAAALAALALWLEPVSAPPYGDFEPEKQRNGVKIGMVLLAAGVASFTVLTLTDKEDEHD